jgi:hypothetical protein
MKRKTTLFSFLAVAVLAGSLATLPPAAGQDPGYLADVREAVDSYAASLSTCDVSGLATCTSAPFHERLRIRLGACTPGQLGSFRRTQHETALEPDLVQVTLLWTQSDGVLETVLVSVKKDGGRWVVAGGEVP